MKLGNIEFICNDENKKTLWLYDKESKYLYRILLRERYGEHFCFDSVTLSSQKDYATLYLSEDQNMIRCPYCGRNDRRLIRRSVSYAYDIYQLEINNITPENDPDFLFHAPFIVKVKYEHPLYQCSNSDCKMFYRMPQTFTYKPNGHHTKNFAKFLQLTTLYTQEHGRGTPIVSNVEKINQMKSEGDPIIKVNNFYLFTHDLKQVDLRKRRAILKKKYQPPYMLRHWIDRENRKQEINVPDVRDLD